jgi:Fur family peroxide stress response transcriptional regulator
MVLIINMKTQKTKPPERRKSRQRERIYELIKMSSSHPTAQHLYDTLKKEIKTLSLGNLYRNLKILTEDGRISSREFEDGLDHYDAITGLHYHFICEKCGSISDFSMPFQKSLNTKAQNLSGHIIKEHTINFYGICRKCK